MFQCNTCDKKYLTKAILTGHTESPCGRIYQCDKRDNRRIMKYVIRFHKRSKHSGVKPKQILKKEMQKQKANVCFNHVKETQKREKMGSP